MSLTQQHWNHTKGIGEIRGAKDVAGLGTWPTTASMRGGW